MLTLGGWEALRTAIAMMDQFDCARNLHPARFEWATAPRRLKPFCCLLHAAVITAMDGATFFEVNSDGCEIGNIAARTLVLYWRECGRSPGTHPANLQGVIRRLGLNTYGGLRYAIRLGLGSARIAVCPASEGNIPVFVSPKSRYKHRVSSSTRAYHDRPKRGVDAVDAAARARNRVAGGS